MRGEDRLHDRNRRDLIGSPPHARGRRVGAVPKPTGLRITPACAGKTSWVLCRGRGAPDHPRMRGEDALPCGSGAFLAGSPPHARGRQTRNGEVDALTGITPACAGKTNCRGTEAEKGWDHPRMRGEDGR